MMDAVLLEQINRLMFVPALNFRDSLTAVCLVITD